MICNILLPVDGSEGSSHAARHVAAIAKAVPGLKVHLLNVQPVGDDWMVRRMIKAEELDTLEKGWAESALAPARAILQAAGLSGSERVAQGDVAETIVRVAKELGCEQIIMGSKGLGALGGLLLGSVVMKVLHLADMPVTLVK